MSKKTDSINTTIVQAGIGEDDAYHAIIPPLYMSSTFEMAGIEDKGAQEASQGAALSGKIKYEYSRTRNPTRDILAKTLAEMESGYAGCVTASGMAAITLILHLLNPDDLLIAPYDCYGRAYRLLCALSEKGHFKLKFIDQYSAEALDTAFSEIAAQEASLPERQNGTLKMVLIESPSNPVLRVADIAAIAAKAKALNPEALIVCDNTFLSPVLQKPLDLGADIVFHSTTKFLNGHSDIVGGAVVAKDKAVWEDLDFWANSLGVIGAPFDAHMVLRGMRTLSLRVERAQENAGRIAAFLDNHPAVDRVYYPGLPSHAGHAVAKKQQAGFGAMLSVELSGDLETAKRFVDALSIFSLAQSLGGTESLINHPATMTHVAMGAEARAEAGVTDALLRLSVGVEDIEDLLRDLEQALEAAA